MDVSSRINYLTSELKKLITNSKEMLFLITPYIILYSQGYRIDWNSKKIIKTGGFYFKVWPKNVEIYLDGELKKRTDFIFGQALVTTLLPKKYEVEIKK
jgi:hypothetical protein